MTKASFDTISGLLTAIIGCILLRSDYGDDNWWPRVLYGLIVGGIWVFNSRYNNLPKR